MKLRTRVRKPYVYSDADYDVCKQKKLMMKIKKLVEKESHANTKERNTEVLSKRAAVEEENPDELGKAIIERDEGQIRCKITNNKMKQRKYGKKKPGKSLQAQEPVPALNLVFAQKRRGTEETGGLMSNKTRTAAEGSVLIQGFSSFVVEEGAAGESNSNEDQAAEKTSEYSPVTDCTMLSESVETEGFPCVNSSEGPGLSLHKEIRTSLKTSVPVKLFPQLQPTRAYQKRKLLVDEDECKESANVDSEEDILDMCSDSSDLEDETIKTINKRTVTIAKVVSHSKLCSSTMESLLESLGLTSLQHVFSRHKISVHILAQMSDEELRDVGVFPFGDRFKLRTAAKYFVAVSI